MILSVNQLRVLNKENDIFFNYINSQGKFLDQIAVFILTTVLQLNSKMK